MNPDSQLLQTLTPSVENVTFHMEKMGENENETNLQIGSRVHFLLAVQFPDADTTDMLVRELVWLSSSLSAERNTAHSRSTLSDHDQYMVYDIHYEMFNS